MSKSKTYQIDTTCSNCDYDGKAILPKGQKVNDVLDKTECPTCGCKTLSKKSKISLLPFTPLTNYPYIIPNPLKKKKKTRPFEPMYPQHPDVTPKRWPNRPWDGGPAKFPFGPITTKHTSKVQRKYELASQPQLISLTN